MSATRPCVVIPFFLVIAMTLCTASICAEQEKQGNQETGKKERKLGWSNSTDLSFVVTAGNSDTETLGLGNTLRRRWKESRFQLRIDATRANTADDPFFQIDGGIVIDPNNRPGPEDFAGVLIEPPVEPDVEQFFFEPRYDASIKNTLTWNAGATWDRNLDAGILSRTVIFAGLGNLLWDREDLRFKVSYGLSFTRRIEEDPDPEKESQFPGIRGNWEYSNDWGKVTTFESNWAAVFSLKDLDDWSSDMTNSISVKMSAHLALKVSLRWLYNNQPALRDVDVIARLDFLDPDPTVPGDDVIVTVDEGGFVLELGETSVRREQLDTVFNTSLVVKF
jgi:putative salt-induced outer membrane protein YdiY